MSRVDADGRPHSLRNVEAVIAEIGNDYVPGSGELADCGRHGTNETCTGDKHVLAEHRERQGCVRGVSERIHDCDEIVRYARIDLHHIGGRDTEVLGKGAVAVHAYAYGIFAYMFAASAAVAAMAAGYMPLSGDAVADLVVTDSAAELDNLAYIFVAYGHRRLDCVLGPLVPIVDVQVSAADRDLPYLYKNVIHTDFRHRDVFHPYTRLGVFFYQCFHLCGI